MTTKKIGLVFGAGLISVLLAYSVLAPKHKTNSQTVTNQVLPPVDDSLAQVEKLPVSETDFITQQEAELDEIYFNNQLETKVDLEPSQEALPAVRQLPQNKVVGTDETILDSDSLLEASLLDVASYQKNVVPTRDQSKTLASISTEVMAIDGTLKDGFAYREDCNADPCANNIIEIATDKIVWNGTWQAGFLPTYNGKQVIRVNTGA